MKKRNGLLIILFSFFSIITIYANERDTLASPLAEGEETKLALTNLLSPLSKKKISSLTIPVRALVDSEQSNNNRVEISDDLEKKLTEKLQNNTLTNNDPTDDVRKSVGGLLDDELKAIARARQVIKGLTEEGILTLKWEENVEEDLKGYQVYTGNGPDVEFAQITNKVISNPTFTDSVNINTLASFQCSINTLALVTAIYCNAVIAGIYKKNECC